MPPHPTILRKLLRLALAIGVNRRARENAGHILNKAFPGHTWAPLGLEVPIITSHAASKQQGGINAVPDGWHTHMFV
ncbi:uncharacterized protein BO96DRAFT_470700 [Aspergillus niger CBS 101883]|uniref:uncharacterized protein n=1 Tax=Aspergillus lacticoffeatus (strain CBS 101883) TaxID=1450533 RepID=UPI000D7EE2B6|nr:uncharacterized protein BO96DRAFT_470700 [Aspergillus niger CBS 101883]PYH50536.1 hypothetical protein BO96DRAFT_470700 [Aspergillus niger CBS 101883]